MKKSFKKLSLGLALFGAAGLGGQVAQAAPNVEPESLDWKQRSQDEVEEAVETAKMNGNYYEIQWGDTLISIAKALDIKMSDLKAINQIEDPDFIKAGAILVFDEENNTLAYAEDEEHLNEAVVIDMNSDAVAPTTEAGIKAEEILNNVYDRLSQINAEYASEVAIETDVIEEADSAFETAEDVYTNEDAVAPLVETATDAAEPVTQEETVEVTDAVAPVETEEESVQTSATEEEVVETAPVEEVVEVPLEEEIIEETPVEETVAEELVAQEETAAESELGRPIQVTATAYSTNQVGLSDYTADGTNLHADPQVIAVDPSVIPLGSIVYIPGYGTFRAADTGGAIVGNRIDIHFSDVAACHAFGVQNLTVYVQ